MDTIRIRQNSRVLAHHQMETTKRSVGSSNQSSKAINPGCPEIKTNKEQIKRKQTK